MAVVDRLWRGNEVATVETAGRQQWQGGAAATQRRAISERQ
jgi:hypothetical protein